MRTSAPFGLAIIATPRLAGNFNRIFNPRKGFPLKQLGGLNLLDFLNPKRTGVSYFRRQRITLCYEKLGIDASSSVLDVGGNGYFWEMATELGLPFPASVTILNRDSERVALQNKCNWVVGNATEMPFSDCQFDLVFSNSVIEHVGTATEQAAMASEVRRVGKGYWVQTPDPRFPVEPHYSTPFVHWLPKNIRRHVLPFTVWGLVWRPTEERIESILNEIRLISKGEFKAMFPDASILVERFAGLPKSLVAFRRMQ